LSLPAYAECPVESRGSSHTFYVKQAGDNGADPIWVHNCTQIDPEMENKILFGTLNKKGVLIGAHSGDVISDGSYTVTVGNTNPDGTINASVSMQTTAGNMTQPKNSTLFPPSWDYDDILDSIKQIGDAPAAATRQSDGSTLHQGTVNGVDIVVIKKGDNVTAGYPTGGGFTTVGGF
jgi:hypothetical protein